MEYPDNLLGGEMLLSQARRYRRARRIVLIVGLVVAVAILGGYGTLVTIRIVDVQKSRTRAQQVARANDLWMMVGGMKPSEASPLGNLATDTREALSQANPVRALDQIRVHAGEYPSVSDEVGFECFEGITPDQEGKLTNDYILRALQVQLGGLIKAPPSVRDYGLLRWEWGVLGLVAVALLTGLVVLAINLAQWRYRRHYWKPFGPAAEFYSAYFETMRRLAESPGGASALQSARALFTYMQNLVKVFETEVGRAGKEGAQNQKELESLQAWLATFKSQLVEAETSSQPPKTKKGRSA